MVIIKGAENGWEDQIRDPWKDFPGLSMLLKINLVKQKLKMVYKKVSLVTQMKLKAND